MERAADTWFIEAMRLMSEAALQRQIARHFAYDADFRRRREAEADGLREDAMTLVRQSVSADTAQGQG